MKPRAALTDNPNRAVLFMNRLLTDPDNFYTYARLYGNSVAAILAWGFTAKDTNRIEDEKCVD